MANTAVVQAVSPRRFLADTSPPITFHISGASTVDSIRVTLYNTSGTTTVTAQRVGISHLDKVPPDTQEFVADGWPTTAPRGQVFASASVTPAKTGKDPYFETALIDIHDPSVFNHGLLEGGATLSLPISWAFREDNGTDFLKTCRIRWADSTYVLAIFTGSGDKYIMKVPVPDLTHVCNELFDAVPATVVRTAAQGAVPLFLEFPDYVTRIGGNITPPYAFHPLDIVGFEPARVAVRGGRTPLVFVTSAPFGASWAGDALTAPETTVASGFVGQRDPSLQFSCFTIPSPQQYLDNLDGQSVAVYPSEYSLSGNQADALLKQDATLQSIELPVQITFPGGSVKNMTLGVFDLDDSAPILIPIDSTDAGSFLSVLNGTNLYEDPSGLILWIGTKATSGPTTFANILALEYVNGSRLRVHGPMEETYAALLTAAGIKPLVAPGGQPGAQIAGSIMSSFLVPYYVKNQLRPARGVDIVTYAFTSFEPRVLPRKMRNPKDTIEITVRGIGFTRAAYAPKILLRSADDVVHVELHATYADGDGSVAGERILRATYQGVHEPTSAPLQVLAQIDGNNWVPVRGGSIVLYDLAGSAVAPLLCGRFTPVTIKVMNLKDAASALVADKQQLSVTVTFSDDNAVLPGTQKWKALTLPAVVDTQLETVTVVRPPQLRFTPASFRLQISLNGQPPIATPDLYNSVVVDSLSPAVMQAGVAPEGGELRVVGANFVESKQTLVATLVLVTPAGMDIPDADYRKTWGGSARTDVTGGALVVQRVSAGELIVKNVPWLPAGIYDLQLRYANDTVVSPNECLLNVSAWGPVQRTIAFGARQKLPITLAFLASVYSPTWISTPPPSNQISPTKHGMLRVGRFAVDLVCDNSTTPLSFSFETPYFSRGSGPVPVSYSPDGTRFVALPNIAATVFLLDRVDPPQVPVGVLTDFTIFSSPLHNLKAGVNIRIELAALVPNISFNTVTSLMTGVPLAITSGGVLKDRVLTTGTLTPSACGPLAVVVTVQDTSSPDGVTTRSIFPPDYAPSLVGGMPLSSLRQDTPWPRFIDAYAIHSFTPVMTSALGGQLLSISLQDPASAIPPYLRTTLDIQSVQIKFTARGTFGTSLGILPQVDSSESTGDLPAAPPSVDLATSVASFSDVDVDAPPIEYIQEGWLADADSIGDDTQSVINVLAPRVSLPGLYSVSMSVDGQDVFAPTMGVASGGGAGDLFLFESAGVIPNNSSYTVVQQEPTGSIVVIGQFLPPASHPAYPYFYRAFLAGASLRIGPLSATSDPSLSSTIELKAQSVTTTTATFPLPRLTSPETSVLYLKTGVDDRYRSLGALLDAVAFDPIAYPAFPTWYTSPISLTGAQFPYHRERVAMIQLKSDEYEAECIGTIESSTLITFTLPSSIPGDLYSCAVVFGRTANQSYVDTGLTLSFYEALEFEPACIAANPAAWASETSENYLTIWGFAFVPGQTLTLQLLNPTDNTVAYTAKAASYSFNEMRVLLPSIPPAGEWKVKLVPPEWVSTPEEAAHMLIFDDMLTVAHFVSFFPHFGEEKPNYPEVFTITKTSTLDLDISQPIVRWISPDLAFIFASEDVSTIDNVMVVDIPQPGTTGDKPIGEISFSVQCTVSQRSQRVYGKPGSGIVSSQKYPIFRIVDPAYQFRFLSVKEIFPRYCGPDGGEFILIQLSSAVPVEEQQQPVVTFGTVPGTEAAWYDVNMIGVKTPKLSATPNLAIELQLSANEPPMTFEGFYVYELTGMTPAFAPAGTHGIFVSGNYLPGQAATLTFGSQAPAVPPPPPKYSPELAKLKEQLSQAVVAQQKAISDEAAARSAYEAAQAAHAPDIAALPTVLSAQSSAKAQYDRRLGLPLLPSVPAPAAILSALNLRLLTANAIVTSVQGSVDEVNKLRDNLAEAQQALSQANADQASLAAKVSDMEDREDAPSADGSSPDEDAPSADGSSPDEDAPSVSLITCRSSSTPKPSNVGFYFDMPTRADTGMEAVKIWATIAGNTVPTEIPVAFRSFKILDVQPRLANVESSQLVTITGQFPPEMNDQKMMVRLSNTDNSKTFVDLDSKWDNTTTLTTTIPPNAFTSPVNVFISVGVAGQPNTYPVMDQKTHAKATISLYRISSIIGMTIPTYGGDSFIVIDNVPPMSLVPAVKVGDHAPVLGVLRSSGPNGSNIPGVQFSAPPMPPGRHVISLTLDSNSSPPIPLMGITQDVDSLFYHTPLPLTDGQAFGISLQVTPPQPWVKPFAFSLNSQSTDILRPVDTFYLSSVSASAKEIINIFSPSCDLQVINLSGSSSTLCNGDPISLRIWKNSSWKCLRMQRYLPAFSLDTPPPPDGLLIDDNSMEYPDCREALFGIWRVVVGSDGLPHVDTSLTSEIRLGTDRILIVGRAYAHKIHPALVEMNHELKPQSGAGGATDTAPILDMDLVSVSGVGDDFLTCARPTISGTACISKNYQSVVIDGYIQFRDSPVTAYGAVPNAQDVICTKSASSLSIGGCLYLFATDTIASKTNNIYYDVAKNGQPSDSGWKPLLSTLVASHSLGTKSNVRAVAISDTTALLFQQTQATGVLQVVPIQRDAATNELTALADQMVKLYSGFDKIDPNAGAAIYHGKFSVLRDSGGLFHIFTVPANQSSIVIHLSFKPLPAAPFIDANSGLIIGTHGFGTPLSASDGSTRFSGLLGSKITLVAPAYTGLTPIPIRAMVTSTTAVTFNRYSGPDIVLDVSIPGVQTITIPALVSDSAPTDDPESQANAKPLSFQFMSASALQVGDMFLFQVMPAVVSPPQPLSQAQIQLAASGAFTPLDNLKANLTATAVTGKTFTLQVDWLGADDPDGTAPRSRRFVGPCTLSADKVTAVDIGNGITVTFPSLPAADSDLESDTSTTSPRENDIWTVTATAVLLSVESIGETPGAAFSDLTSSSVYLALPTYHGDGCLLFLEVDLTGQLKSHYLSECRTLSEVTMQSGFLLYRGLRSSSSTWARGVLSELGGPQDLIQSARYGWLGDKYRQAYPGLMYKILIPDIGVAFLKRTLTASPVECDLDPPLPHPDCTLLVPPVFAMTGTVEVLGAAYAAGISLKSDSVVYQSLSKCNAASPRVPSGIFAPSYIYKIDRAKLQGIQKSVTDKMEKDINDQNQGKDGNPFADGSSIWDIRVPLNTDDYHDWQSAMKWIYQLSLVDSLIKNGASQMWSTDIQHKVLGFIPLPDSHRAGGDQFFSSRLSSKRSASNRDKAMNLRGFKFRYSEHIKDELGAAFPDLQDFTKFGGICNLTAISLCYPSTLDQMKRVTKATVDDCITTILTELRYFDSTTYNQVQSYVLKQSMLSSLSAMSPPPESPNKPTNDDGSKDPPDDGSRPSPAAQMAQALGPIGILAAGAMTSYGLYSKFSARQAARRIAQINAKKTAEDAVREHYAQEGREGMKSWATDGDSPRDTPSLGEKDGLDIGDSSRADDAVGRQGADITRKVKEDPALLDGEPDLAAHLTKVEGAKGAEAKGASCLEGAFVALGVLGLVGQWDQMATHTQILTTTGTVAMGADLIGKIIASKFPGLATGCEAALREAGAKISASLGDVMSGAGGRLLSRAGDIIATNGLKLLGPAANVAFAVEGLISSVKDFKDGNYIGGALELASSLCMLGAAVADLMLMAGFTAAEGVGEVLMAIVILIMIAEMFIDPDGFMVMLEEIGSFFGGESAEDDAIDDYIAKLKNWCLNTTLSVYSSGPIEGDDDEPFIIKADSAIEEPNGQEIPFR